MFLSLLKRAVKGALYEAVDEFVLECGLPRAEVEKMRVERQMLAAQAEVRADAQAARALDVDDDAEMRALPMPSAAQITTAESTDVCPAPGDESAFLRWVHRQRERQSGWAEVAKLATEAGHEVGEDALRMRYRRWREKRDPAGGDSRGSPPDPGNPST